MRSVSKFIHWHKLLMKPEYLEFQDVCPASAADLQDEVSACTCGMLMDHKLSHRKTANSGYIICIDVNSN